MRRAGALTLVAGLAVSAPLAVPPPAGAAEKAPARVWRALKRVPRQVGSATRRAYRELEQGVTGSGRRPRPAALPAERPPAAAPADPALDPVLDPEAAPRAEADPRQATSSSPPDLPEADRASEPSPIVRPEPARAEVESREIPPVRSAGPRLAALLGALAGVGLVWHRRRRRRPDTPALAPTRQLPLPRPAATVPFAVTADSLPAPPDAAAAVSTIPLLGGDPGATRGHPAPATGFDTAALDARTEEALADALARHDDDRPTPFPGGGRYQLIREIGRGGMGVVYQAHDKRLDRIVALKRLPENLQAHPRAVQLLLREARSAARLNHPHIVTVYDVDHEDGAYFLTMEYLDGQPLSTLLHRRGRFSPAEAAWLGRQAAVGLAFAHERQIVHRDVKTANLFLTRDRVLKIMDFGLAKMIEAVRRRATRIGGTPDYMAPEQTLGLEVDGRADLYALGVTLFELLSGAVPFTDGDSMRHHRETPPPDLRERAPGVPEALAALVDRLLAKKPDERPASAAEVAERLRAIELDLARTAARRLC